MDAIETFKHAGLTVKLHYDDDGFNPRKEYDNACTMICWHRRYELGDSYKGSPRMNNTMSPDGKAPSMTPDEFMAWAKHQRNIVLLPLRLLDHSRLSMSVGSGAHECDPGGWDSGQIGWAYITAEVGRKEWGRRWREKAEACIRAEVETYDCYLRGEVYGWTVEDDDGETLESCWGYIGDLDYVRDEAKSTAEACANQEQDQRMELAGQAV